MPNFNESVDFNLIPDKTVVLVRMNVKAGGVGEDSALTVSKNGGCRLLVCSFSPIGGEYAGRKVFDQFTVDGALETYGSFITRSFKILKQILNSANNLDPTDMSKEAQAKRDVGYMAFDNLVFYARIGIKPEDGVYEAKNIITGAVMRGQPDWPGPIDPASQPAPNDGGTPSSGGASAAASPVASMPRPSWATPGGTFGAK